MTKQQNLFFFLVKSEGEHPDAVPKKKKQGTTRDQHIC